MPKRNVTSKTPLLTYIIIAVLLVIIVVLLYSNSQAKTQSFKGASGNWVNSNSNYTALQENYSAAVSKLNGLEQNYTDLLTKYNANSNGTSQEVVQVLYQNRTVNLAPPTYNPYYNRVTGCYWIYGYQNFSFSVPYSGYVVFNETNNGIPANFTTVYSDVVFSTEKPRFVQDH